MARRLDFIIHGAEQDFPVLNETILELKSEDSGFSVYQDGALAETPDSVHSLIYKTMGLVHARALESFGGTVRIHAGTGEWRGRRFLAIGDKGAGKSTLMTRLLYDGVRIDGDELVLLREGTMLPFPRRFHLKNGSLPLLPELAGLADGLPSIQLYEGVTAYAFSPGEAGFHWKIEPGEIDAVYFLTPNHGGETRVEECPKYLMAQKIMPMTFLSESGDHMKIAELCRVLDRADCRVLHVGDLEAASAHFRGEGE